MKLAPSAPVRRAALLLLVLVSACQDMVTGSGPSLVRLQNATTVALTDVEVSSGFPPLYYESIAPGGVTEYVSVETVYEAFMTMHATAGDRSMHHQMIDRGHNETPLAPGAFTLRFELTPDGYLTTRLVRDD